MEHTFIIYGTAPFDNADWSRESGAIAVTVGGKKEQACLDEFATFALAMAFARSARMRITFFL